MTVQFVDQHFVDSYYPTIENTFQKVVKYKGQEFNLDIIDTAGQVRPPPPPCACTDRARLTTTQDEFSILSSRHAVGLHGWVLVYSVSSRSSFDMCTIIREKILNYTGRDKVPMVLVGNKSDLAVQRYVPLLASIRSLGLQTSDKGRGRCVGRFVGQDGLHRVERETQRECESDI